MSMAVHGRSRVGEHIRTVVARPLIGVDGACKRGAFNAIPAMVEDIEQLAAEIKRKSLVELEGALNVHIPLLVTLAVEGVASYRTVGMSSNGWDNPMHVVRGNNFA